MDWSDECAVQKDSDTHQVWVFHHQNKLEKYACKNIRGKSRNGGIFQTIWGCFVGTKLGPIMFLDGTVNSDVYIAVLRENLLPYIDAITADGMSNIVFQQDNASPHVSKKTRDWLQAAADKHGFSVMNWPAISPDMNLIENRWAHLKMELHCRYPDTKTLRGGPAMVRKVLQERLAEIWWSIGEKVLDRLVDSMPHRVEALIKVRGWYTKY